MSLKHRSQSHSSSDFSVRFKCENEQQKSKLININWIIPPPKFKNMHYFKHMEYLPLLLVISLPKYCANDYLIAFIWFSSYCFYCLYQFFSLFSCYLETLCIQVYFFFHIDFFLTSCQKLNTSVFQVTVRIWMKVHISGCSSWIIFLLALGSSTIFPISGAMEHLTYWLMPLFVNHLDWKSVWRKPWAI